MADALITEHAGSRRDEISRFYQYGSGGVRVLDSRKNIRRVYSFDPSTDIMTEREPSRPEKVLRRFVFDRYGMLEESFSFGKRPRSFRYENGCRQIAVREGGDYGAVGKIFTFEPQGITETAWGRNGEIERVYQFDAGGDTITERSGGWFGDVARTIVFDGIDASLFREPESFLQFLMFTEWSENDRDKDVNDRVVLIRSGVPGSGRSPYAFPGNRQPTGKPVPGAKPARTRSGTPADTGIDFIPDSDAPSQGVSGKQPSFPRQSRDISFEERYHPPGVGERTLSPGRSVEIPLEERFESSRREREELSRGKSVEIPLEERFEKARSGRGELSKGRSVEIPLEERFENARSDREELSRGKSVDIPLEERFENARRTRGKPSTGRSAAIPFDERKGGGER
jgi:hypothetical protein